MCYNYSLPKKSEKVNRDFFQAIEISQCQQDAWDEEMRQARIASYVEQLTEDIFNYPAFLRHEVELTIEHREMQKEWNIALNQAMRNNARKHSEIIDLYTGYKANIDLSYGDSFGRYVRKDIVCK